MTTNKLLLLQVLVAAVLYEVVVVQMIKRASKWDRNRYDLHNDPMGSQGHLCSVTARYRHVERIFSKARFHEAFSVGTLGMRWPFVCPIPKTTPPNPKKGEWKGFKPHIRAVFPFNRSQIRRLWQNFIIKTKTFLTPPAKIWNSLLQLVSKTLQNSLYRLQCPSFSEVIFKAEWSASLHFTRVCDDGFLDLILLHACFIPLVTESHLALLACNLKHVVSLLVARLLTVCLTNHDVPTNQSITAAWLTCVNALVLTFACTSRRLIQPDFLNLFAFECS